MSKGTIDLAVNSIELTALRKCEAAARNTTVSGTVGPAVYERLIRRGLLKRNADNRIRLTCAGGWALARAENEESK